MYRNTFCKRNQACTKEFPGLVFRIPRVTSVIMDNLDNIFMGDEGNLIYNFDRPHELAQLLRQLSAVLFGL